jgi:hypothetical protein
MAFHVQIKSNTNEFGFQAMVLWEVMPCSLVIDINIWGKKLATSIFRVDGGSRFLRNVGIYLQNHKAITPQKTKISILIKFYKMFLLNR